MFKKLVSLISLFSIILFTTSNDYLVHASSSTEAKVAILPGSLSLTANDKITRLTFNDNKTIATARAAKLKIVDATGSGKGWHVIVKGSEIIETKANGEQVHLPGGSLRLYKNGATITSNGGTVPTFFDSNFIELDDHQPHTVLTANRDEGMGKFVVTFADHSLRLNLSNYNEKSTYSTKLTWAIIQGP